MFQKMGPSNKRTNREKKEGVKGSNSTRIRRLYAPQDGIREAFRSKE